MKRTAIAVMMLAWFAHGVYAGTALDSLTSASPAYDFTIAIPAVPALGPLQADPARSAPVSKENIPGRYVAKLAIEGPYMAVEMIVSKDSTIKVKEGNMDQVSPWFTGKWEFKSGKFSYTCNAPGFENNKTVIDMSGVSRAALKTKEGVQVMVTLGGQTLPFRIWETDKPFFGEKGLEDASPKAASKVLPVGYSIHIKDADRKVFEKVYAKNAADFYNVGRQFVGGKIDRAEFFVGYTTMQGKTAIYLVSITENGMVIGKFRVDADLSTGKVEYLQAED